jgi:hypothetical protein
MTQHGNQQETHLGWHEHGVVEKQLSRKLSRPLILLTLLMMLLMLLLLFLPLLMLLALPIPLLMLPILLMLLIMLPILLMLLIMLPILLMQLLDNKPLLSVQTLYASGLWRYALDNSLTFAQELIKLDACKDAIAWVGDKTQSEAWATCQRGDWMLWLAVKKNVDRKLLVQAACDCAELADPYLTDGAREPVRNTLVVVRAWCRDEATIEEVKRAAYAIAAHAAADSATYAAAAASATDAAADSAAYAATYAAYAAAASAAVAYVTRLQTLAQCADIVRKWIVEVCLG